MNDELKPLMIHVERIVRPVQAKSSRKLRMRRELLEHLKATIEEEQANGNTTSDVLDRAKQRLGDPAKLTAQLQESVPRIEHIFFAKLPMPARANQWEERSEKEWGYLTTAQASLVTGVASILMLIAMVLPLTIPDDRRNAFFGMEADHRARFLTIWLIGAAILATFSLTVISLLGKSLLHEWRTRAVFFRAAIIIALETLWVLLINGQVAGYPTRVADVLNGLALGTVMVTLQIAITRSALAMGNESRKWRLLDLAQ